MRNSADLVERYVALWNDPDPDARRSAIQALWAQDGAQILQPPAQMRAEAAAIGFDAPTLQARGHAELEVRVARAHQEFVATGEYLFRSQADVDRLRDVVKFHWEMVPAGGGDAVAVGLEFLVLDPRGKIALDYQFIER